MNFVYLGFSHRANYRCYHFKRVSENERPSKRLTQELALITDLQFFSQYHVPLQDGPKLCLHILQAAFDTMGEQDQTPMSYRVTESDVSTFASLMQSAVEVKHSRRKAPVGKPSHWAQFRL